MKPPFILCLSFGYYYNIKGEGIMEGIKMRAFLNSFAYALRGIYIAVKTERNFKVHIIAMCLAIALAAYLKLSVPEWGLIIFSIGFVLCAELFNTAVERLGDKMASGERNAAIRNIKDLSAAAVIISALTALTIGIIVLIVPLVSRWLE